MILYDSEGNKYKVIGGQGDILTLKGKLGEKNIATSDLKNYNVYPPKVMEAMDTVCSMLKSGELTVKQLISMKEAL